MGRADLSREIPARSLHTRACHRSIAHAALALPASFIWSRKRPIPPHIRDTLRADEDARLSWAEFKVRLADEVTDLSSYGQIKAPATNILVKAALAWDAGGRD